MTFFRVVVVVLLTVLTIAALAIAYYLHSFYGIFTGSNGGGSSLQVTGGNTETGEMSGTVGSESVADQVPAGGFTVDISTLPETQQAMLRTLGYENTITFTPEMIVCAEGTLGSARVAEIMGGAAPSMMESASLMACL